MSSLESLTEENGVRMTKNGEKKKTGVSEMVLVIYRCFMTFNTVKFLHFYSFYILVNMERLTCSVLWFLVYIIVIAFCINNSPKTHITSQRRVTAIITMEMDPTTTWISQGAGFSNYLIR